MRPRHLHRFGKNRREQRRTTLQLSWMGERQHVAHDSVQPPDTFLNLVHQVERRFRVSAVLLQKRGEQRNPAQGIADLVRQARRHLPQCGQALASFQLAILGSQFLAQPRNLAFEPLVRHLELLGYLVVREDNGSKLPLSVGERLGIRRRGDGRRTLQHLGGRRHRLTHRSGPGIWGYQPTSTRTLDAPAAPWLLGQVPV